MEPLKGYDAPFALRCWRGAMANGPSEEIPGHDAASLNARAEALVSDGAYGYVELAAWNFELNDWVRMAAFAPR
ncbi:MAG: hypothetical protein V4656_08385 [Pseudomonadota bacterium]